MAYDLRPRAVRKDFMPLLFYALPRELFVLVGEHAAARPRHRYNLHTVTGGQTH
jgi:hypothetical protein